MEFPGYSNYLIFPGDDNNKEGYVWSKKRKGTNNRSIGDKYLKPQLLNSGYLRVSMNDDDNIKKSFQLHRLIASCYLDNKQNKSVVDHINGDRCDHRLENLRWATHSENALNTHTGRRGKDTPYDWITLHSKVADNTYYRFVRSGCKGKNSKSIPKLLCYSFFYLLKNPP
tara:strand:- start:1110 stop:1619 length:510 start_codon:yes stop_codon:yes gene_type:complete